MAEFDVHEFHISSLVRRLRSALDGMRDLGNPRAAAFIAEGAAERLDAAAPGHPEIRPARALIEKFKADHPGEFGPLPPFRAIGSLDRLHCPACGAALAKEPQRKTICRSCRVAFFVRERPLDGESVLLLEGELADLEEDWLTHYQHSQREPRGSSAGMPLLLERVALGPDQPGSAAPTGPDKH